MSLGNANGGSNGGTNPGGFGMLNQSGAGNGPGTNPFGDAVAGLQGSQSNPFQGWGLQNTTPPAPQFDGGTLGSTPGATNAPGSPNLAPEPPPTGAAQPTPIPTGGAAPMPTAAPAAAPTADPSTNPASLLPQNGITPTPTAPQTQSNYTGLLGASSFAPQSLAPQNVVSLLSSGM